MLKIKTSGWKLASSPWNDTCVEGGHSANTQIYLETDQTTPTTPIPGGKYFYMVSRMCIQMPTNISIGQENLNLNAHSSFPTLK